MALHHPVYENPDVLRLKESGQKIFNPRTRGELKAELLDRPAFTAQEMTFASSQKKIVITGEFDDFGSTAYRAVAFTLDINIQSGIYRFQKDEHGPILSMSYIECVEIDGRQVYHLNQADVGTLHLSVVESCYSARLFTMEGLDHNSNSMEMCGEFSISPPHASF
ncbi:hypothetical protein GHO42_22400 [Pseudomonas sp. FSL R10-0056]|mgnify:FL=1|uniref:Uncharacterized protein n=4 Tax=Pseudomonas TaxID=286 RepID=A0A267B538_PSEFR|nr:MULTISPECIES: hypothetical protein [Pseudomonas]MBO4968808.1 hypothetical protein [Pseudomonas sp.]MBP3861622.1 hypothetical protein [Pseudomonas sp.]MBP3863676.1 hypothetical protein [Pseudomonas sp.]MBP3933955.1 hypothetical protein [Pseudomonas sp.]MCH4883679.1 hypothetical protein [Pseudomonas sp. TMW22080]